MFKIRKKDIKNLLRKSKFLRAVERACKERGCLWSDFRHYLYNYVVTYVPNFAFRRFCLTRLLSVSVGRETYIHMGCMFIGEVSIGNNTVIGRNCYLGGKITIGDNVAVTAQTYIYGTTHIKDSPCFEGHSEPVEIKNYAWIGARAMICSGVTIGEGAILGAASTATKDIPPLAVFAGCPARQIGMRSSDLRYTLRYFPYFS